MICGESVFQRIGYFGEINTAQVVTAEINSINQENNTADITLAPECTKLQLLDTSAVPFFYHCQDSTGTEEDLAQGFRAFNIGDIVYVLHLPSDDLLYIIGHVDIKGTQKCSSLPIAVGAEVVVVDEVGVNVIWERLLERCIDPVSIFMTRTPVHLLNVRYLTPGNGHVSLIVAQDEENSAWQVIVDRGNTFLLEVFPTTGMLYVSAALNDALDILYVVVTRFSVSGDDAAATGYTYGYSDGSWVLTASHALVKPYLINSARAYIVDRDGRVAGFWGVDTSAYFEQYTADGSCSTAGTPGQTYTYYYLDYNTIYGGYFNMEQEGFPYIGGSSRRSGSVFIADDFSPATEDISSTLPLQTGGGRYAWDHTLAGYTGEWLRDEEADTSENLSFSVVIGSTSFGTKDIGLDYHFSANSVATTVVDTTTSPSMVHDVADYYYTKYEYHDGQTGMIVTPGGWVTTVDSATVKNPVDMSSYHYDAEYPYVPGSGWGQPGCPDFHNDLVLRGIVETARTIKQVVYPESLGSYEAIHRSFSSYDQKTGVFYAGAMVQATLEGTPAWIVYKNGVDITADLQVCINKPLSQFHAIYWRA